MDAARTRYYSGYRVSIADADEQEGAVLASLRTFIALITAVALAGITLAAQTAAENGKASMTLRGPDGHPDLSGIWEHNAATPLERPDELAGRATLTDNELAQIQAKAAELFSGDGDAGFGDTIYLAALRNVLGKEKGFKSRDVGTGDYNSFWVVGRWFEHRTSLITDPPTGKLPALTVDAQKRQAAAAEHRKAHPFDGPEDIAIGERCITGSVPMLGAGYNNYYQIVQSPTHVAVNMEMRHDSRMIPITDRPHLPNGVHLWLGDPIGRWDGDTFVVDSTNFRNDSPVGRGGASEKLHLIERFSRVDASTLKYEVTIDDPMVWARPWTAVLFMKNTKDQIYEYACHEGNEAMFGTLNGTRVQEKNAREKATKSTSSSR
jgi:hypothetical protein